MKQVILTIICAVLTNTSFAYYQSEEGRWTSRDPIREDGGINVYCFLDNSSLNRVDYLGLNSWGSFTGNFMSPIDVQFQITKQLAPPTPKTPSSGGISASFLMATHDFVFDDGCRFYCISWTPTEVLGVSGSGSIGDQEIPVTVSYGVGKHLSVGTSGTTVDGNLGIGVPILPVQVSVRLDCWSIGPEKAKDGCPCKELKPISVMGMSVE